MTEREWDELKESVIESVQLVCGVLPCYIRITVKDFVDYFAKTSSFTGDIFSLCVSKSLLHLTTHSSIHSSDPFLSLSPSSCL